MIRRIYLDIDGVLNAFGADHLPGAWPSYRREEITAEWDDGDMPTRVIVHVAPEVLAAVHDWHDRGVEIVHMTTWAHNARRFDERFGLPVFESLTPHGNGSFLDFEKLPAVHEHLREHPADRAVWVDDYLVPQMSPRALRWVDRTPGIWTVAPEGALGLRQHDLDRIERLLYRS